MPTATVRPSFRASSSCASRWSAPHVRNELPPTSASIAFDASPPTPLTKYGLPSRSSCHFPSVCTSSVFTAAPIAALLKRNDKTADETRSHEDTKRASGVEDRFVSSWLREGFSWFMLITLKVKPRRGGGVYGRRLGSCRSILERR